MSENIVVRLIAFALLLSGSVILFNSDTAVAERPCEACQRKAVPLCENPCVKYRRQGPGPFQRCQKSCVRRSCLRPCSMKEVPAERPIEDRLSEQSSITFGSSESSGTCGTCLKNKKLNECRNYCEDRPREDMHLCLERCSKRRCAGQCRVPGANILEEKIPEVKPKDCRICRRRATQACSNQCGPNKERPGYVSCEVACVEQRCLKPCNPQVF